MDRGTREGRDSAVGASLFAEGWERPNVSGTRPSVTIVQVCLVSRVWPHPNHTTSISLMAHGMPRPAQQLEQGFPETLELPHRTRGHSTLEIASEVLRRSPAVPRTPLDALRAGARGVPVRQCGARKTAAVSEGRERRFLRHTCITESHKTKPEIVPQMWYGYR
ncbi:Alpha-Protein Kinase 2 [Manis pentadactyla]|nr:Alpha-Protein Kinase 2 [Manis pentadactyla]